MRTNFRLMHWNIIRDGGIVTMGTPSGLKLQSGKSRMEIKGQGFSEQILAILKTQTEVATASLQNGQLIIDLADEANPSEVTRLITENGAVIEDIYWSEIALALMEEHLETEN